MKDNKYNSWICIALLTISLVIHSFLLSGLVAKQKSLERCPLQGVTCPKCNAIVKHPNEKLPDTWRRRLLIHEM